MFIIRDPRLRNDDEPLRAPLHEHRLAQHALRGDVELRIVEQPLIRDLELAVVPISIPSLSTALGLN